MPLTPLPTLLVEPLVRQALIEDLGRAGDITTDAIAPLDCAAKTVMAARQEGVIAGLDLAAIASASWTRRSASSRFSPTAHMLRPARPSRSSKDRREAFFRRSACRSTL